MIDLIPKEIHAHIFRYIICTEYDIPKYIPLMRVSKEFMFIINNLINKLMDEAKINLSIPWHKKVEVFYSVFCTMKRYVLFPDRYRVDSMCLITKYYEIRIKAGDLHGSYPLKIKDTISSFIDAIKSCKRLGISLHGCELDIILIDNIICSQYYILMTNLSY